MDNITCCRGLAIAVRDEGSVSGVQFTNISVEALFFERSWKGAAEPIHITAMPRTVGTKVRLWTTVLLGSIVKEPSLQSVPVRAGEGFKRSTVILLFPAASESGGASERQGCSMPMQQYSYIRCQ